MSCSPMSWSWAKRCSTATASSLDKVSFDRIYFRRLSLHTCVSDAVTSKHQSRMPNIDSL
jgi:hypothetical protein